MMKKRNLFVAALTLICVSCSPAPDDYQKKYKVNENFTAYLLAEVEGMKIYRVHDSTRPGYGTEVFYITDQRACVSYLQREGKCATCNQ
jgi:hypothetical protein